MNDTSTDTAAPWIRLALLALAGPQLVVGLWAVFAPRSFYDDFGLGATWVSADGPYNMHLTTDAGAGFLATGVLLLLGAWWGRRREVLMAVLSYAVFAVPHFLYHLLHDAPGLSASENAQSVLSVAFGAGAPFVLLFALWRTWDREGDVAAPAPRPPTGAVV